MKYFDLHCDTLCECYEKKKAFYRNGLHVDLGNTTGFDTYIQCCAAWIPDQYHGDEAYRYFLKLRALVPENLLCVTAEKLKSLSTFGGIGLIPTVEGGSVLGGSLERISEIARLGVKMLTLTWNANNEIGGGIEGDGSGLTAFGKQAVPKLERENVLIDVSHASMQLFDDVCSYSKKPFLASHSNAKAICAHKRNLSDGQIKELIVRRGLIGVNFCEYFLENVPEESSVKSIIHHIEYLLSLGAENILAFGSDFDGSKIPGDMIGVASVKKIWDECYKLGYSEKLLSKLFYGNAYSFLLHSFDR